jgi:16S rRNA processing protein RimM
VTSAARGVAAGVVGRAHGLDGSFYLEQRTAEIHVQAAVHLAGREEVVERLAGSAERPILRLRGVTERAAAEALRGETLYLDADDAPLADGEYLAADLVGCIVPGLGRVERVIAAPSCDLLEVEPGGVLVPFVRDAVERVDTGARRIDVRLDFLGLAD